MMDNDASHEGDGEGLPAPQHMPLLLASPLPPINVTAPRAGDPLDLPSCPPNVCVKGIRPHGDDTGDDRSDGRRNLFALPSAKRRATTAAKHIDPDQYNGAHGASYLQCRNVATAAAAAAGQDDGEQRSVSLESCGELGVPLRDGTLLRQVVEEAAQVFHGGTRPTLDDLQRLSDLMQQLRPQDVGLRTVQQKDQQQERRSPAPRSWLSSLFNISQRQQQQQETPAQPAAAAADAAKEESVVLPAASFMGYEGWAKKMVRFQMIYSSLPLHDHPGMVVLSQVIGGSLEASSFSWAPHDRRDQHDDPQGMKHFGHLRTPQSPNEACRLSDAPHIMRVTKEKTEERKAGGRPMVLYPRQGNLHELRAATVCAMFDVLSPPYDVEGDRDCRYYRLTAPPAGHVERDVHGSGVGEYAYVRETPLPPDFATVPCKLDIE
ncbi:unnamed protein product [Vitrella brassicaformis CCMP3155]|uniref:Uncharacterized protein n=1 Tax=Vitrella brassicaformis (strain CCMP3155) TaxID=1169540 RepID=A0A0G4GCE5_VITBC|nr:unnamed protein product [Vitrella brassicaformis CCMP3155]|eukprot:CEM26978.1 unnamed protein product [Vitrella brassicaformis CCMP3155]